MEIPREGRVICLNYHNSAGRPPGSDHSLGRSERKRTEAHAWALAPGKWISGCHISGAREWRPRSTQVLLESGNNPEDRWDLGLFSRGRTVARRRILR